MSRLADLIELIQGANDVYLANPDRNARSAYIQIDQLCELILKSWLQANVSGWSAISHTSPSGRNFYKGFRDLMSDVRGQTLGNTSLHAVLDQFRDRRDKRNNFFHNPDLAGLTVQQSECLQAYCELYELMELLFATDYTDAVVREPILRTQIAMIRLRNHGRHVERVLDHYRAIIGDSKEKTLQTNNSRFEYYLLYDHPGELYDRLKRYFMDLATQMQGEIDRIDGLVRPTRHHHAQRQKFCSERDTLRNAITRCLTL